MSFWTSESGAVTVDWVVLTGALVGLGLATMGVVSGGVEDLSNDTATHLENVEVAMPFGNTTAGGTVEFGGSAWATYFQAGNEAAPGNSGATYAHARALAAADAPDGYNFDTPLIDQDSGHVIYTSDDGNSYAINGEVIPVEDYDGTSISVA